MTRLKFWLGVIVVVSIIAAVRHWPEPARNASRSLEIGKTLKLICGVPLAAFGVLAILALGAGAFLGYRQWRFIEAMRASEIRRMRAREPKMIQNRDLGTVVVYPDQSIRILELGIALDADGGLRSAIPQLAGAEQKRRMLLAGGGWPGNAEMLPEPAADTRWPQLVDLRSQFVDREPTLNDLVVGVYPDENGLQRLSASIYDLMHVLAVGASGWGKSSWLRSLVWQLAKCREAVEVVAIDVSGAEFNALHNWSKLRYPVAREPGEAAALLDAVSQEVARRKALYEAYPIASSLTEYNGLAGEPLIPWVILIDEGTALLNEGDVGQHLRRGVQTARQYGCYFVVTGQSANHRVIETQTRDQFSTRLCFRTSPTSSRVVLEDSAAGAIKDKGRAYAQLVGRELCEIQGPYITKADLVRALDNGGPKRAMPEGNGDYEPELVERIKALYANGLGLGAIAEEVWGYRNSRKTGEIKAILGLE